MNTKEYQIISGAINHCYASQRDTDSGSKRVKQLAIKNTAIAISEAFKMNNDHFKQGAFLWACGVKDAND